MPLILRLTKGSALTYSELDGNFTYLSSSFVGSDVTSSMTVASSSHAQTASFALNAGTQVNTGSFVTTSSFNNFTSSYSTGSFTGSFTGSLQGTSSFAISASWAPSMLTGSFATTGSNQFNGDQTITGSLSLSGSRIALGVLGGNAPALRMTTSSFELGGLIGQVISYGGINILDLYQSVYVRHKLAVGGFNTTVTQDNRLNVKGYGSGSSTSNTVLVNSSNRELFKVLDDGTVTISGSLTVVSGSTEFQVTEVGTKIGNSSSDYHQVTGSLGVSGSALITDVLTLPFQDPLPAGKPTSSIALSGSGGTFEGMYVYNGTSWVNVKA